MTTMTTRAAAPRKKKNGGLARLWLLLHGWLALPIWAFVFLVCVTGTLATISHEIIWAINSEVRALRPDGVTGERISAAQLVATLQEQRPGSQISGLSWPAESHFAPTVSVTSPQGAEYTYYVNPYDGHIQGEAATVTLSTFLRALHGWLFLPWTNGYSWGWYAVSIVGIPMMGSLITGILVYKKFWRAYLKPRLRFGKGARTFWGDFHRLSGIWSIPFIAIISVTSIWFLIQAVLSDVGVTLSTAGAPQVLARDAVPQVSRQSDLPVVQLDEVLARVEAAQPGLRVRGIGMPSHAFDPVHAWGNAPGFPLIWGGVSLNPYDYSVVTNRGLGDKSAAELVTESMRPLHTGDFMGLGLKIVYFLFGVLLSMMVLSGMLIWTKRTVRTTKEILRGAPKATHKAAPVMEPAE